jgi:hypothetical protein
LVKYRQLAENQAIGQPAPGSIFHKMVDLDDVRYPGVWVSRLLLSYLPEHPRASSRGRDRNTTASGDIAAAIFTNTVESASQLNHRFAPPTSSTRRPIGFEIPELIPDLVSTVRYTGRESVSSRGRRPDEFLAFIDADHDIPALLDVLRLALRAKQRGLCSATSAANLRPVN